MESLESDELNGLCCLNTYAELLNGIAQDELWSSRVAENEVLNGIAQDELSSRVAEIELLNYRNTYQVTENELSKHQSQIQKSKHIFLSFAVFFLEF